MNLKYQARNDVVVIRLMRDSELRGLLMPDQAQEGKWWQVLHVGSDVKCKDLQAGMRVVVGASPGQGTFFPIPGEKDTVAVDQKFILAIAEVAAQ